MNFVQAVQILTDAGVEFAIIGGWSAIMHGSAHLTNDLDLCYSRASINLQRLARALAPYHPRPAGFPRELPFVWDERTLQGGTVFTLDTVWGGSTFWRSLQDWGTGVKSENAACGCPPSTAKCGPWICRA